MTLPSDTQSLGLNVITDFICLKSVLDWKLSLSMSQQSDDCRGSLFALKQEKTKTKPVDLPFRKPMLRWVLESHASSPNHLLLPRQEVTLWIYNDTARLIVKFVSFYSVIFITACSSVLLVTAVKKRFFFFSSLEDLPWIWEPFDRQSGICCIQWMWNTVGFVRKCPKTGLW